MQIHIRDNRLVITGNVKSIQDSEEIKKALQDIAKDHISIELILLDSISLTSSVIGFLVKLAQKDRKNILLKVADNQLYDLLQDLNLYTIFPIEKIQNED